MWDLPRPGIEPVSPALAGGFLTTVPPGKSQVTVLRFEIPFAIWAEMCLEFMFSLVEVGKKWICPGVALPFSPLSYSPTHLYSPSATLPHLFLHPDYYPLSPK